ncbi:alanine racemase [Microbacteriaceae bacterium MWH-Ta3]|nr:alanine racemase [Microbacteriaceae bacterium MWH-Ta3]
MSNSPYRAVEFSATALAQNVALLRNAVGVDEPLDLRNDAYGHGQSWVRDIAHSFGFHQFWENDSDDPIPATSRQLYGLSGGSPVATVAGEVVAVKAIPKAESVSYGYTWTAERDSTLALVALGFADGIPRGASNQGLTVINHVILPTVGRIAMDQFVVDITDGHASVGDLATLWTTDAPISTWTANGARDPLIVIHNLGWRIERRWVS